LLLITTKELWANSKTGYLQLAIAWGDHRNHDRINGSLAVTASMLVRSG